ncbi:MULTISPECIES: carboxypeptidase regulatory-like domain-containing protein [Sphingobacterium]|uniref:carboxypeptidase regulatory-like domain-containing protein n=1 Tax=Sphingobacterium TaxID=28453 RepID=UPI00257C2AD4|nr:MULTISPECIES: carboxypeptidase regulatory-like domain-containing protein [Sphingobacterium]
MRKYLLLFIVFFTIQAFAQHRASVKIIGYVKNADGKALSDATVYIKNTAYSTSTDKDGHYILVVVPGKYEIIGSKVGFLAHKEFATVNNGENKYLQFDLNADPSTTLDQVVVAGKSGIQEVRESPFNVVALDAKA